MQTAAYSWPEAARGIRTLPARESEEIQVVRGPVKPRPECMTCEIFTDIYEEYF